MSRKLVLTILSTVIMLYFLCISIYTLGTAFGEGETGNIFAAAQVVGWISFLLFLLGVICLFLTIREDSTIS